MLEQGNITIHTENIFPIIKQSLYSDREIFLRELIANATDAITKLRMASLAGDVESVPDPEIEISIDKENRILTVSDTGIGMTAEEVKKYINQVAFSSAEEFIQKYKGKDDAIIGHFGLGFYSSFMVSETVEIDTLSFQKDSQAVHWSCDGTTAFTLSESQREKTGTTVTLKLAADEDEYLEPERIRTLVRKYCDFIPVPIKLDGQVINKQKATWKTSPSELTQEEYLEFYRYLYPLQEDPLFWVHINTDYPFIVQGILYFPKLKPDIDPTRGQIKLFCNQVFIQDNCEEVIPKFLLPLRGTLDSPDIPLNVSRSFLQNDRTVRRIGDHVAKKVADRLNDFFKEDFERYVQVWPDISLFVKFGAMNDDKFSKQIKDSLIFKIAGSKTEKPEWVTLPTYLEGQSDKKKVYYTTDEMVQSAYVELHKSQGLSVIVLDNWIDSHFISYLEQEYPEVRFQRVDAELDDSLVDKAAELIDPVTNKTRSELLVDLFKQALGKEKLQIKAEALKSEAVPAMILMSETIRRIQEMSAVAMQQVPTGFLEDHTLVLNTTHPLIQNVQNMANSGRDPELIRLLCNQIYELALVTQKSFDANTISSFVIRSNEILTRLTR